MDAATGLLYVGNGQYYDPATGRFLTRDVNPDSTNPYVPWNPIGAIVGPLGLIALVFGRRKKGSKAGTFLVLLVVLGSVGMTLAACGGGSNGSVPSPTIPPSGMPIPGSGNSGSGTPGTPTPPILLTLPDCPTPLWTLTPIVTPTGTPTPGIPMFTELAGLDSSKRFRTNVSAQEVYNHYIFLWNYDNHGGWWWDVYGKKSNGTYDGDGFSFWDYLSIYMNHEALYTHTEFADIMAEAGGRFWSQRIKEGYEAPGDNGFANWWAGFSQSNAGDIPSDIPDQHATVSQYQSFRYSIDQMRNSQNSNWATGLDLYRPYNWGNLSAIELNSPNSKVGQMLRQNASRKPIFGYIPGGDPFFIPSGCAQVNWIDGKDTNSQTAWDPTICDYLLSPQ